MRQHFGRLLPVGCNDHDVEARSPADVRFSSERALVLARKAQAALSRIGGKERRERKEEERKKKKKRASSSQKFDAGPEVSARESRGITAGGG